MSDVKICMIIHRIVPFNRQNFNENSPLLSVDSFEFFINLWKISIYSILAWEILLKQLKKIDMRSKRRNYNDLINWLKSVFCYWDSMPVALIRYFRALTGNSSSSALHPRSLGTSPSNTSHRPPGKTQCFIIASANIDHCHLALSLKPR